MARWALIVLTLTLGAAYGAEPPRPDGDLVSECKREIGERFLDAADADHLLVSHQEITRSESEDRVRLTVASGEGRTVSALCKFRGGKLFDVVR
ncbi:MAG: hypothetical protein JO255_06280 [Alphaproteobacteria bacterium]|nr:hypothetical protein [Alphaproteobacteria bacterium]